MDIENRLKESLACWQLAWDKMPEEWIVRNEGRNLKFKRETLLNYAMNRWGLNKAHSVGPPSELIRKCAPETGNTWEEFYFENATQKKINS